MSSSTNRWTARSCRWAGFLSAFVVVVAMIVILGWLLDLPVLQRVHRAFASMKFNTAIACGCLGLALRLAIAGNASRVVRALVLVASAVALATLLEDVLGLDLGVDELVCRDPRTLHAPGRMAPATAVCVLLISVAVWRIESWWTEWLALGVAVAAHVALLGYLYGVRDLYEIGPYTSVALHTALVIYALALGVLLARQRRGLMRELTSDSPGGVLARRLVPAAIVLPVVLGLLRQWGEHAGLYSTGAGRAMLVTAHATIFVGIIWRTAAAVRRGDELRRAAVKAGQEREAHLAITLASIGDGVIATDEHGRILDTNPAAERLTGWSSADARGRELSEVFRIVNEDTGAPVENPVARVLREGVVVGLANHTVLIARNGTRRAIADCGAPMRDEGGVTQGVVLVFQDQSEARAAERRLRQSETRKAAILASALDAVVSIDAFGAILEFNPAAEAMFGHLRAEVLGTQLAEAIIPPALRDAHRGGLARYLATSDASVLGRRVELTAVRADGREFPVELSITRVGPDEPPTFTGFIRDVTEARRARAQLVQSNDRLRALARVSHAFAMVATNYQVLLEQVVRTITDLVGDGCLVTMISEDGERLENVANAHRDPAIERDYKTYLAGVSVSKLSNNSIAAQVARTGEPQRADASPSDVVAQCEEALRPVAARLNVHSFAVVPIRARQTVIGTLSLLRSEPGHSYTADDVTLMQDLADRAGLAIENARLYEQLERRVRERTAELGAANQQLEASNQQLEAFSSSAAHDLRAPLRSISGFSHALLEDYTEQLDSDGRDYLIRIRHAAQQMGQLIDDLLNLSRVSRSEFHPVAVNLTKLARDVVARLQAAEPTRDVIVVIEDGMTAAADSRLVEIALTNLLGNAWKFTSKREGARIEICVDPAIAPTTYVVRDNGAGFDPAYADKLFGVFQRLHTASEFPGTGIGLATVQRVIHRHGGKIRAESEVGGGATFYFTLQAAHGAFTTNNPTPNPGGCAEVDDPDA